MQVEDIEDEGSNKCSVEQSASSKLPPGCEQGPSDKLGSDLDSVADTTKQQTKMPCAERNPMPCSPITHIAQGNCFSWFSPNRYVMMLVFTVNMFRFFYSSKGAHVNEH